MCVTVSSFLMQRVNVAVAVTVCVRVCFTAVVTCYGVAGITVVHWLFTYYVDYTYGKKFFERSVQIFFVSKYE